MSLIAHYQSRIAAGELADDPEQRRAIAINQRMQRRREALAEIFAFSDQHSCAARCQGFRVAGLMIIDRVREGHQHAAKPRGRQLGKRERPRAADRQIGPGVGGSHVLDERLDFNMELARRTADAGVGRARLLDHARAALVPHREFDTEAGKHGGQLRVQAAGALAAAQHEHAQGAFAALPAQLGCGHRRNRGAHRIADRARLHAVRKCIVETTQHTSGEPRQHTIGHARHPVLFVHEQRSTQQEGGDAARTSRIAPQAEHAARAQTTQHAQRLEHRTQQQERRLQQAHRALAAQRADPHGVQLNAGGRHQARFQSAFGAEPDDRHVALAQHGGHFQPGEDVPAGSACHDQHRPHHATSPSTGSMRKRPLRLGRRTGGAIASGSSSSSASGSASSPRCQATWRSLRSSS